MTVGTRDGDYLVKVIVYAVVGLCFIGATSTVILLVVSPTIDHTALVTVVGLVAPVVTAMMALLTSVVTKRLRGLEDKVNGRMDELLQRTGQAARLTGRTEATQAGQALAIVDSAEECIWSKDLEGNVLAWNKSAEKELGWNAVEMLGRSVFDILPKGSEEQENDILHRLKNGERLDRIVIKRVCKDGRAVNMTARISPIHDHQGKVIAICTMARPIDINKPANEYR